MWIVCIVFAWCGTGPRPGGGQVNRVRSTPLLQLVGCSLILRVVHLELCVVRGRSGASYWSLRSQWALRFLSVAWPGTMVAPSSPFVRRAAPNLNQLPPAAGTALAAEAKAEEAEAYAKVAEAKAEAAEEKNAFNAADLREAAKGARRAADRAGQTALLLRRAVATPGVTCFGVSVCLLFLVFAVCPSAAHMYICLWTSVGATASACVWLLPDLCPLVVFGPRALVLFRCVSWLRRPCVWRSGCAAAHCLVDQIVCVVPT